MTNPTTEELKELLGKVTQGEWYAHEVSASGLPTASIMAYDGYTVAKALGVIDPEETQSNATIIAIAPTLAAEVVRLRGVLSALLDLNDNYSPFGGEMYQDRIDRTWETARQALSQK